MFSYLHYPSQRKSDLGKNCFDEVRFLLAFIVLIAHTIALADASELMWFAKYFDSFFAVKGFFAISGYLVTKSFYSSGSFREYAEKRIRRIYPAYILVIFYCLFVGLLTTQLPLNLFIANSETFEYLAANLAFLNFLQPALPEALLGNKMQALNGSLWTIKIEVMLYGIVPFLCLFYATIGKIPTYLIAFITGVCWYVFFTHYINHPIGPMIGRQFVGQLPYFALGSLLGFFTIRKEFVIAIVILSFFYYFILQPYLGEITREIANMLIYPLFVIAIATTSLLSIGLGKIGDLSYGIYLFHFPTIQMLQYYSFYDPNPYVGLIMSIIITVALSYISWHLVEKRFLKRSSHYLKFSQKQIL